MTALLKYDAACRAVAEAKSFDEVREWEDKAAAVREYSRRARNRELELDALEIRERARRRRGEFADRTERAWVNSCLATHEVVSQRPRELTLILLGVSYDESSRDQKIATLSTEDFERLIAQCRAHLEDDERKHGFDVLRERDGPVNGARAIMGSRQEPDDSLDFFPTPPWATRALIKHVIGDNWRNYSFWEPACGESHIAYVLEEYFFIAARRIFTTTAVIIFAIF